MTSKRIFQLIEQPFEPFYFGSVYIDGKAHDGPNVKGKPFETIMKTIERISREKLFRSQGDDDE